VIPEASTPGPADSAAPAWYCVRSQPKHEHIAAGHLTGGVGVEVYLPRIRFRRATRRGPVWFNEPLFPGYLFARFDLVRQLRQVHHARGVRGVVHFGNHCPAIPEEAIRQLQSAVGADAVRVLEPSLAPGDEVTIASGPFAGLLAVVSRVMPGRERVAILLEFLGRQTSVELSRELLIQPGNPARHVFR